MCKLFSSSIGDVPSPGVIISTMAMEMIM